MKTLPLIAFIAACGSWAPVALADTAAPRVEHFQARQADDLAQTLANLREANQQLAAILAGEVGEYDMHDIHSLSYTIEDSLARLSDEYRKLKDVAADMHFASEGLRREEVIEHGRAYLQGVQRLLP